MVYYWISRFHTSLLQLLVVIALITFTTSAWSGEPVAAQFTVKDGKVSFWQTNMLSGIQGGYCVATFGFEVNSLRQPIDNLTLSIRVIDQIGRDLGLYSLRLEQPLGGSRADRYQEAVFGGEIKWPDADDISPLCYSKTRLIIESATGSQENRKVDLIRFRQLEFTEFPRLNIKLK